MEVTESDKHASLLQYGISFIVQAPGLGHENKIDKFG